MLGERREGLKLGTVPPSVVMMVGLQGSGKTTTACQAREKAKGRRSFDTAGGGRRLQARGDRPAGDAGARALDSRLRRPDTNDVVKIARGVSRKPCVSVIGS